LPPLIQKQVVEEVKVVEKIVEREVVTVQGASPEELQRVEEQLRVQNEQAKMDADRKRQEVASQLDMAEGERKRLLAEIDLEEKVAMQEAERKKELANRLSEMEQKMVAGKQVMEKAIEQEEELRRKQKELKKQNKVEEKLKQQEEAQRQENMELEEKCASQEEQVSKLTAKLQKLWDKYQKAQQEMVDVQQFNQGEREEMLQMIRELRQTLKLKTLIMEAFVPLKEVQSTQDRAVWDAEEDEWKLQPTRTEVNGRPQRPASAVGLPRPTSEFSRMNRAMGDSNPRYMYDSIVITDLDLPERTTEDYETHPELGDRIERSLLLALSPDDDDGSGAPQAQNGSSQRGQSGNDRPSTGHRSKRPSSGRPGTGRTRAEPEEPRQAAFPQARGLVSRE